MERRPRLILTLVVAVGLCLVGAVMASVSPRWCLAGMAVMCLGTIVHVPVLLLGCRQWGTRTGKAAVVVSILVFAWVVLVAGFYVFLGPRARPPEALPKGKATPARIQQSGGHPTISHE